MGISPSIVHFSTKRARLMRDVACEFACAAEGGGGRGGVLETLPIIQRVKVLVSFHGCNN